jgi:catechol 2,3-dioxygenase-like lactoylglutathione lyase family enzyme
MEILGLVFAGTSTDERTAMARFLADTLGLRRVEVAGAEADMFALPDGSHFAVADPHGMGETSRSIGFRVDDLDAAIAAIAAAGGETGEVAENDLGRYAHFRAPDGNLYELVEERDRLAR